MLGQFKPTAKGGEKRQRTEAGCSTQEAGALVLEKKQKKTSCEALPYTQDELIEKMNEMLEAYNDTSGIDCG